MLNGLLANPNKNTIGTQRYGKSSDTNIVIHVDGTQFSYEDSKKSAIVEITSGDHFRKLVAKAVANALASGKQVDYTANDENLKVSMALLQETGKTVVAHNKAMVASQKLDAFGCFRRHLQPEWII